MTRTLTILDTASIQSYVFGSNRLRENVVASSLVDLVTSEWASDALQKHAAGRHTLIYSGGGNLAAVFERLDDAKQVVRDVTLRALINAPGLQVVATHLPFDGASDAFGGPNGAFARAQRQLRREAQRRRDAHALPGLSVTRVCRSTGLPSIGDDEEEPGRPVSAEVAAKTRRDRRNAADQRLRSFLAQQGRARELLQRYAFSRELDDLGRTHGEQSYIAVVHADGNGMGRRIQRLLDRFPDPSQNAACVEALGGFSRALANAGAHALQRTLSRLILALEDNPAYSPIKQSLALAPDGRPYFPLRPIVFGGDDVTLVCDGRIGLGFAAAYLEEFRRAAGELPDGQPAFACAGVAIVKTHYPFARAYALSVELCDKAKALVRDEALRRDTPDFDAAALDWHLAVGGISGSLDAVRERLYIDGGMSLIHRPLFRDGPGWEAWDSFVQTISTFNCPEWRERQNKVLALREALRGGPAAARAFRTAYGVDLLPPITGVEGPDYRRSGWVGETCAYFDAIEALDFYLPLDEVSA